MGALWTNYLIKEIYFTQTQIGYAESVAYLGAFLGVLIFAWVGVRWQDRLGLKTLFKIFIIFSICINLTQYLMVEPYFSRITGFISHLLPDTDIKTVRWGYFAVYNFFEAGFSALIRMSTFSLVGAVIPVAAAGSLFAGFMSVGNLAYSFSYASGAWLYENGLNFSIFRVLQQGIFQVSAKAGDNMSILLLIFIGSCAYLLSFLSVHMLPDKKATQASCDIEGDKDSISPDDHKRLGQLFLKRTNQISLGLGVGLFILLTQGLNIDLMAGLILAFLSATFLRKVFLDWRFRKILR